MRSLPVSAVLLLAAATSPAAADEPPSRRIELAATVGYAGPAGEAERGSRVSDTAFGAVPFALDGSYRLTSVVGVAVHTRYAITIPTLCASAADCQASLGSDAALGVAVRFHVPRVWLVAPLVDVGLGYEWLSTRLVDAGAVATRSYDGPVLLDVRLAAPFSLAERGRSDPRSARRWVPSPATRSARTRSLRPAASRRPPSTPGYRSASGWASRSEPARAQPLHPVSS
jgi:hypothetical protein